MTRRAEAGADVRSVIAAAVAAGVPAGLLYALAGYFVAMPPLLEAERFETGVPAAMTLGRLLWGLAGAVGVGCALALVLTPIVRATGRPGWRTGAAVGGLAFLAMFLLPALVTRPGPPGVEHTLGLGVRQGVWLLAVLLFAGAWALGRWVHGRLGGGRWALAGAATAGAVAWAAAMGLFLNATGTLPALAPGHVPAALSGPFAVAMLISNGLLFLGLALLIPVALRRLAP
jgi:predicted cobalt transporter CbtA